MDVVAVFRVDDRHDELAKKSECHEPLPGIDQSRRFASSQVITISSVYTYRIFVKA